MGAALSSEAGVHSSRKCPPSSKLVAFPKTMNAGLGDLITYFHARPQGYSLPSKTPEEEVYWWPDIDFIPFQDNCLFVSIGAYLHRPNGPPVKAIPMLQGLIYVWKFNEDRHRVEVLKGSRTSVLPNVSVHPSGECILYIGTGQIHLMNIFSMKDLTKSKGASMSNFLHTTQSPNGYNFAFVSRMSSKVELGFYYLDSGIFLLDRGCVDCNKLCPGFKADGTFTERYRCKFSKDSTCVAVASSFGHLMVVMVSGQQLLCNVSPGIVDWTTDRLANERSFDFDHRYPHEKIAFGSDTGKVYFCDLVDAVVDHSIQVEDQEGRIQCVKYSPNGEMLAVASSRGLVRLLDSTSGECCLTLDAVNLVPDAAIRSVQGELAQVVQMVFTTHGEQLAISSTDGYVRIWQLPRQINLQDLCSRVLLKCVGISGIGKLPLPQKLVDGIWDRYTN